MRAFSLGEQITRERAQWDLEMLWGPGTKERQDWHPHHTPCKLVPATLHPTSLHPPTTAQARATSYTVCMPSVMETSFLTSGKASSSPPTPSPAHPSLQEAGSVRSAPPLSSACTHTSCLEGSRPTGAPSPARPGPPAAQTKHSAHLCPPSPGASVLAGRPGTAAGQMRSACQGQTASDQAGGVHGSGARPGSEPLRAPGILAVYADSSEAAGRGARVGALGAALGRTLNRSPPPLPGGGHSSDACHSGPLWGVSSGVERAAHSGWSVNASSLPPPFPPP